MRIAFYHYRLPQRGRKPGGVQVFVDRLASALQCGGHEVTVFTFARPAESRQYNIELLRPRLAADSRVLRLYLAPWLLNFRPFQPTRFDVAHLHGDDWFYMRRRVPTVRTFYGSALLEALTATSLRRRVNQTIVFGLEQLARAKADAVYGIGPDSKLLSRADGILECGVDLSRSTPEPVDVPTILFVGTWRGRKRGSMLARVFSEEIRPRLSGAELWMVSDHAETSEGIRWFPAPTDEELEDLYRRAWVFCLPSSYEGLGLPYLEALANRLPVVATPNPGAEYVLSGGDYGIITEPHALGEVLLRLLMDAASRAELANKGTQRVSDFSWDRIVTQHEAAYELAIERFAGRQRR